MELPWIDPDFISVWEEWLQYRKERRLPKYVPTGLKKTFGRLINISGGRKEIAIQIINQSMEQGYQGLFPLKNNGTYQQSSKRASAADNAAAFIASAKAEFDSYTRGEADTGG